MIRKNLELALPVHTIVGKESGKLASGIRPATVENPVNTRLEQTSLFQEVLRNPEDDAPRLILADFLEERGDPRADFIRVQCQRAQSSDYDSSQPSWAAREAELWRGHGQTWSQLSPEIPSQAIERLEFRRGFVDEVWMTTAMFLKYWRPLFHCAPVRIARLSDVRPELHALMECAALPQLEGLVLRRAGLSDMDLQVLADCAGLCNLKSLDLQNNGQYQMVHQEFVTLSFGASAIRTLLAPPAFAQLTRLNLSLNSLGAAALQPLRETVGSRSQLEHLNLNLCGVGDAGLRILEQSALASLVRLDLSGNQITADSVAAISSFPRLQYVDLGANELGDEGLSQLSRGDAPQLRVLRLQGNSIGDSSVRRLAHSPWIQGLEALDLRYNAVSLAGFNALGNSPFRNSRLKVFVELNRLGDGEYRLLNEQHGGIFDRLGQPK